MTESVCLEKRDDRIAILTLNRPEALNAIDRAMVGELRRAIADIEADADIDIMIMAGAQAFCVGVDLKERQELSDEEAQAFRLAELFPMYEELERRHKPAIAAVNGHCLAGGLEIALCCDMILATEGSRFGLPEVKWGLIPAAGGCHKLVRLIGRGRASEMIMTAEPISAQTADRIGLINRIVAADALMDEALNLARNILVNSQAAVRRARLCIDNALDFERARVFDIAMSNEGYAATDRKEGIARFGAAQSMTGTGQKL